MSRELDVQIATRVMGLMHDAEGKIFKPAGTLYHWHTLNCPASDGIEDHHYSTDLNACRRAELRLVELGHGEKYREAMEVAWALGQHETLIGVWLLTAPAEARCKAMLTALEGKK